MNILSTVYVMGQHSAPTAGAAGGGFGAFVPIILLIVLCALVYRFVIKPYQKNKPSQDYVSPGKQYGSYQTTRVIAQIVSFIGWITTCISFFALMAIILKTLGSENHIQLIGLLPVAGGFISGLFLILAGQLTRAIIDNTDYTKEIVTLLKESRDKE